MTTNKFLKILIILMMFPIASANDYVIFSISQDVPMGDGTPIKKNFYVNLGKNQGLEKGTFLDVLRDVARNDSYGSKKRYHHSVKIGELEVLHTEENSSIARLKRNIASDENAPHFEIKNIMIGDKVQVMVED